MVVSVVQVWLCDSLGHKDQVIIQERLIHETQTKRQIRTCYGNKNRKRGKNARRFSHLGQIPDT
jgi:hypothetical protein